MKKRKLKSFVVPTIYVACILTIFLSIILMQQGNSNKALKNNVIGLFRNNLSVISEDSTSIIKPFKDDTVKISKYFYKETDDEETRKSSIIYYEDTYLQNTGILYSSDNEFEILSILPGKVTSVHDDDILGKVVYVEYNKNITIAYYSLSTTNLKNGDFINQGDLIGTSGNNKLENVSKNNLLIEVYKDGKLIDPIEFYNFSLDELDE